MSGAAQESDRETASLLRRGEAMAIERLYDRYGRLAFGLAFGLLKDSALAEEVVQDSFLALWRNGSSFDARKGSLRSWLLSIVHNRAIDRVRGRRGAIQEAPLEEGSAAAEVADAWESVSLELERKQVREALASLPTEQRHCLELAYFGGLTHVEIARRTELPLGTVKGRLRLGLEKLRSFLQARGVEA